MKDSLNARDLYVDVLVVSRRYWIVFITLVVLNNLNYWSFEFTEDLSEFVFLLPRLVLFAVAGFFVCAVTVNRRGGDKAILGSFKGFIIRYCIVEALFHLFFYTLVSNIFQSFEQNVMGNYLVYTGYIMLISIIYLIVFGIYFPSYLKNGNSSVIASTKNGCRYFRELLILYTKGVVPVELLMILAGAILSVFFAVFEGSALGDFLLEVRLTYFIFAIFDAVLDVMFFAIAARLYWISKGALPNAAIFD
ncbi:small-conductance mechanosensitive channel [Labrenzia sp. EL_159]|nr:small-conductance mechanosensitive channel [Labrenzia sp. EL_162]MBG6197953.1 small-conductance mechanosensitive channel [Labrenzia sp. EL_159]